MVIDVMNLCKITCDHDRQIWSTPSGIQHSFFKNRRESVTFSALVVINSMETPNIPQKAQLDALLQSTLPPKDTPLTAAKITPHQINVQRHTPIKQRPRRIAPALLKKVHAEVDKLLRDDRAKHEPLEKLPRHFPQN